MSEDSFVEHKSEVQIQVQSDPIWLRNLQKINNRFASSCFVQDEKMLLIFFDIFLLDMTSNNL